jgi:hypothetical protein
MKQHLLKVLFYFNLLIIFHSPDLHSQNDTLIKYLSSSTWLWPGGDTTAHRYGNYSTTPPLLTSVFGDKAIYLNRVSSSDRQDMIDYLYLLGKAEKEEAYSERLHRDYDRKKELYDSLIRLPEFSFSDTLVHNFYLLDVKNGPEIVKEGISEDIRVMQSIYIEAQFLHLANDPILKMEYDYYPENIDKPVKKRFRYKVVYLSPKQIKLDPVK